MGLRHQPMRAAALTAITSMLLIAPALTGCQKQASASTQSVAFVVGDRSNTKVPSADELLVEGLPSDLVPGAVVAAFGVDGSAGGVELFNSKVPKAEGDFEQKEVPVQIAADLRGGLENAKPAQPEANTLGAIGSAARALRDASGEKKLIVADSMLSTAGVLQFQAGLLDSTPEDVVASVNKEELPDLSGIDVEVYGAGEVRDPQRTLTESKRSRLEAIWAQLFKAAGVKSVAFHSALDEKKDLGTLPPVTVIAISQSIAAAPPPDTCVHVLSEQFIQFVPDTAEFVDPVMAHQTISAVVTSMNGCSGTISVIGTTSSWGDPDGRQRVSQDRADAVRDELAAAMGIDPLTIVARGVGMDFPEYVNDRDPSGRLIPAEAAKNRTVRISEM